MQERWNTTEMEHRGAWHNTTKRDTELAGGNRSQTREATKIFARGHTLTTTRYCPILFSVTHPFIPSDNYTGCSKNTSSMKKLYPPQAAHVERMVTALKAHPAALDSSIMGAGKTLCAIRVVKKLGYSPIVVCPKVVVPSWIEALNEEGVSFLHVANYEQFTRGNTGVCDRDRDGSFDWICEEGMCVVFDEVHRCKGSKSLNGRLLLSAVDQGVPVLMLSATPAEDPSEMKAVGYALGLHSLNNYALWARQHGCSFDPWGRLQFNRSKGEPFLKKIKDEIYPDRGSFMTRKELEPFFTENSIITDPLDFDCQVKMTELFEDMETEIEELRAKAEEDGDNPLTELLRQRQTIELLKVPVIVDLMRELEGSGYSVPVFVNFNATIDAILDRMGKELCGEIRGGDTQREEDIERFQEDKSHFIVANIQAGGVGVSLHDINGVRPRYSLISPTWNAKDLVQTLGRIDRAGSKTSSLQRLLFAAGTVEETVAHRVRQKVNNLDTLHDSDLMPLS